MWNVGCTLCANARQAGCPECKLIGTYDNAGLHFHIDDPLGTRRAQVNSTGQLEAVYQSLPFGDVLNSVEASGVSDPTENHFTGKERDVVSDACRCL
jgi:hypothetical protein